MNTNDISQGPGRHPDAAAYPLEPTRGMRGEDVIADPHTQSVTMIMPVPSLDFALDRVQSALSERAGQMELALGGDEPQARIVEVPTNSILRRSFAPREITRKIVDQVKSAGIPAPVVVVRRPDSSLMALLGDDWVGAAQKVLASGQCPEVETTLAVVLPHFDVFDQYLVVLAAEHLPAWSASELSVQALISRDRGLTPQELARLCGCSRSTISERERLWTRLRGVWPSAIRTAEDEALLRRLPHSVLYLISKQATADARGRYLRVAIEAKAGGRAPTPAVEAAILADGGSLTRSKKRESTPVTEPDSTGEPDVKPRFEVDGSVERGDLILRLYEGAALTRGDAAYGIQLILPILSALFCVIGVDDLTRLRLLERITAIVDHAMRQAPVAS